MHFIFRNVCTFQGEDCHDPALVSKLLASMPVELQSIYYIFQRWKVAKYRQIVQASVHHLSIYNTLLLLFTFEHKYLYFLLITFVSLHAAFPAYHTWQT